MAKATTKTDKPADTDKPVDDVTEKPAESTDVAEVSKKVAPVAPASAAPAKPGLSDADIAKIRCACVRCPGDSVRLSFDYLIALGLDTTIPANARETYENTDPSQRARFVQGVLKVHVVESLAKLS